MTLKEFKDLNRSIGNHWFSEGAIAFFKSKIHDFDEDTGFFISSEQHDSNPRYYTIRKANFQTGRVTTVSAFQEFESLIKAQRAMRKKIL